MKAINWAPATRCTSSSSAKTIWAAITMSTAADPCACRLIGQVQAGGLTVRAFEEEVKAKLDDGFMKDAKVSVAIANYRPFYIIGEVNKPGEYPYVSDMSVLNAVALAGGYTYRANDSEVYIQRNGQSKEQSFPADQTTKVQPGDIVRVPERFF